MLILLTGGSACGKSHYAEKLCLMFNEPRYYVATMRPYGEESLQRISRHRIMRRGKGFETVEKYTDIDEIKLPQRGTVLLECLCNLTANEMFDDEGNSIDPCDKVMRGVRSLKEQCENLIVVTNDVGSDSRQYSEGTRDYIRALGKINAVMAQEADCVYELVCGIPIVLKGEKVVEK